MIKKTTLKQVKKILNQNTLIKSTTTIRTKKLTIYNVPCSTNGTGENFFSIPTGVKIEWLRKQDIMGKIDFREFFKEGDK